jgi:hypothetical protein
LSSLTNEGTSADKGTLPASKAPQLSPNAEINVEIAGKTRMMWQW